MDIRNGVNSGTWTGAGATRISGEVEGQLPNLIEFRAGHTNASRALSTYVEELENQQRAATSQLNEYNNATAALSKARSSISSAQQRYNTANGQVGDLDRQLREKQAQRLLLVAAQQPTASIESQLSLITRQRSTQINARDQASEELSAARRLADDAEQRQQTAKSKIDACRHSIEDAARVAADQILAAVGIVESHNPFVRAVSDSVHSGGQWLSDNIDIIDTLSTELSVLALALCWVPIAGQILAGAALVVAGLDALGHAYRALNNQEGWGDTAWAAVGFIPAGRILGKLAKVKPKEFDSTLGAVKRLVWTKNASRATHWFSSHGIRIFGHTVHRVHTVPRSVSVPISIERTVLSVKIAQDVAEDYHHLDDVRVRVLKSIFGDPSDPARDGDGPPMTVVQIQGGSAAQGSAPDVMQSSTTRIQGP